jgi:hypothetical protein
VILALIWALVGLRGQFVSSFHLIRGFLRQGPKGVLTKQNIQAILQHRS